MDEHRILKIAAYLIFIIIGIIIYKVKPNYFIGYRTPWALNDENNWVKTNRFGAKVLVGLSLIGILVSFLPLDQTQNLLAFVALVFIMVLLPIIYSYRMYKN